MDIPMNKKQYAKAWERESQDYNSNKTYETLSKLVPDGKVLEIGCGIGLGTYFLAQNHEVLSLDNNKFLINKAKNYINNQKNKNEIVYKEIKYKIHYCELFELTLEDKSTINKFKPNIIVGWFIGAGGEDVNKYTEEEKNISIKGKLYREKLEKIILDNLLVDSVEVINFVIRGQIPRNSSKQELDIGLKEEYDTFVFKDFGFEVNNVEVINWDVDNSTFLYSSVSTNPNLSKIDLIPIVISITAKRRNKFN
jgi:SAM-dependent methyltransferase